MGSITLAPLSLDPRCVDISSHPQGSNHTIFALIGLNDNCFTSCIPAPTDGLDFINFIHEACIAHNNQGERIITPGTILLTDCASVHSGFVQRILQPYLEELGVQYLFIPKFSPRSESCGVLLQPVETEVTGPLLPDTLGF